MRADMRSKIKFLRLASGKDEYGEPINTWEVVKENVWASKEPLLGNEYFTALTNDTKVEVKFRTYYFDGVTNDMRIQHSNDIYEILSAINVKSLNRELLCYCKLVKE